MKKMNFSRAENSCFLLLLVIFQVIFVLILYRGSSSVLFRDHLEIHKSLDYSKSEDVYINLSLFTPAPHKTTIQTCTPQSNILVGLLTITFDTLHSERTIIHKNPYVHLGGCYSPPHCLAHYKTAIIVPCRNYEKQLHQFLYYLHPFLQRQQLSYCIYLIHQAGTGPFNRAKLLNVGIHEAMKDNDWDCLLLHNMDLIPENDYNLYVCDKYYPKHLSTAIDKFYRLPYSSIFGGVIALTPDHYMKINGFPNTYWERLDEDDDIAERISTISTSASHKKVNSLYFVICPCLSEETAILAQFYQAYSGIPAAYQLLPNYTFLCTLFLHLNRENHAPRQIVQHHRKIHIAGMKIIQVPLHVGRYKMMGYGQTASPLLNLKRPAQLHTSQTWKDDGTNSLVFKLIEKKKKHLYTHIMVDIGATPALPPPSRRKRNNT